MLETLFKDVEVRQPLLAGPMGPYLDVLTSKLLELGYCHSQARKIVRTASALGHWLAESGLTPAEAGKADLKKFISQQRRAPSGRLADGAVGSTRLPGLLHSSGILCRETKSAEDAVLHRFENHLVNVRGVRRSTSTSYLRYVRPLVVGIYSNDEPEWWKMTSEYVSGFVVRQADQARAAKHRIVSAVRTFLRFMVCEGTLPAELVRAIPRVRRWRYAELPKRLSAAELELVLKDCQSEEHGCLRDRAFIALLARLGVRSGELRSLRLDDIDWSEGLLHIKESKSGHGRTLPLPGDAGKLVAEYIRNERPTTEYREIFLTSLTPRRPLGNCTATTFVNVYLHKLGLDGPGRGCHSFRHTAATLMVQNGASLKEVADVLGHRSLSATGIYVKLDEPSLQDVALPWKGGKV